MMATIHEALRAACADVGIVYRDVPVDGRFHETDVEDDPRGRGDGRIKVFTDCAGGIVCNWKGETRPFFADDGRKLSESERRERDRKRAEAIRKAEEEEAMRRAEAAKKSAAIWQTAKPASNDHPYLALKGVKAYGLRVHQGRLVVPMHDGAELHSLQFIGPDGDKKFLTGGPVTGCYFSIGKPDGVLCIAEGYATGAAVHQATGYAVAVAFNAGNLEPVAQALREKFPDARLILCADDDYKAAGNPGMTKATEAARAVGGLVAVPDFGEARPDGATDFNDLAQTCGAEAVKRALANARAPGKGKASPDAKDAPASDSGVSGRPTTTERTPTEQEAEIARLARLSRIEYDRERNGAAQKLGCRVTTLDVEVARARGASSSETITGTPVGIQDVEPWPHALDGDKLLDDLAASARRFIVLPKHGDVVLALWVLFTHCLHAANTSPILALVSPEKRCGKTTVLDWLSRLVRRKLSASNITAPALFRCIEAWTPTLLIDEADSFLRDNEELRGVINSGHTRASAFVVRTVGDDHEPRCFTTWGAKAIALIGKLPDTLHDRSVVIEMRRKLATERIEKLRHADKLQFDELRRKCARWAQDNAAGLRDARPTLPEKLNDRAADNWEPLLAIVDVTGGEWQDRARKAAITLSGDTPDADSLRVELLRDLRSAFAELRRDRASSAELIGVLTRDQESRWAEFHHGRPITPRQLARLLAPFGVKPDTLRLPDGSRLKGYDCRALTDVFTRYIPPSDPCRRDNDDGSSGYAIFSSVTESNASRIRNENNALMSKDCHGVTDKTTHNAAEAF